MDKIKEFIHSKNFILLLIVFLMLMVVITGTYAWFTWSSTENTELTMTIGRLADVVFDSGNDITTGLTPVFNYYDGESTTFSINNRSTESLSYVVKLNITTIDSELVSDQVKYAITKDGTLVAEGDLSSASDGISINVYNSVVTNNSHSFVFYLYIDGNEENDLTMMNKKITGTITVEEGQITPLSDFTYYLGSEYSSVDTISYYISEAGQTYEAPITSIALETNEVLLIQYNGESTDVVVPDTYVIDDITYNVILFTDENIMYDNYGGYSTGVFTSNTIIKSVVLGQNIEFVSSDASNGSMEALFWNCTSLVNAPEIPSSVTNMSYTFSGCTSLVNAPEIPNSVTDMSYTFYGCTSLVNASEIPNSVINMGHTFRGCTNLVQAPEIPSSVTNMSYTFSNCTSLTGTVRINSSNVSYVNYIFTGTSKAITVEVPAGSTTYTKISALTTSNGMPSNVTLSAY